MRCMYMYNTLDMAVMADAAFWNGATFDAWCAFGLLAWEAPE